MMPLFGASKRKPGRDPAVSQITFRERLRKLASSPWVVSCSSFVVTALLIQSDRLTFF